ncbi:MAG: uracil-DNA glycosylase [Clostridia bacterium]|nr:uracil-DNA glycosylase [Clostridia bacterium]MBP3649646.1 uracil-DNA glycosylase [Clostridia bacterium]
MDSMQRFIRECTAFFDKLSPEGRCPLVFGDGQNDKPVLMLIGEAPGEQETLQGKPFVGKAGKNLTAFLEVVGLDRNELYVSNVVKVRPTKRSPAGGIVNRPPNREEKLLFTPWLMREIAIVHPDALVTLGNVALQAFMEDTVGNVHGRWHRAVVSPPVGEAFTLPLFPLYHPASVIYNRSLADVYQADLVALRDSLTAGSNLKNDT